MSWLAPKLIGRIPVAALANPPALVELFAETIVEELDFRLEAANMLDIAELLAELGQRGYVVPRPHPRLVTRRVLVMERLSGLKFDDVAGMRDAGIDTEEVIRTGMIAFMEGDDRPLPRRPPRRQPLRAAGRADRAARLRHRRPPRRPPLTVVVLTNSSDPQDMARALELGAHRYLVKYPSAQTFESIKDLRLDQPPVDPTTLTGDELVKEVQRVIKALLGYGARMPKELMLYVKNMVFLDGAIARLAPDLDILAEIANISMYFAQAHGERLGRELGIDHTQVAIDLDGVKASFGLDASTDRLTYRDLQRRRELINKRMRERVRPVG